MLDLYYDESLGEYPHRPVVAHSVTYHGPVEPDDWEPEDLWVDDTGDIDSF